MAEFPKTEEGIIQLAQTMISGMTENADYPAPPVPAAQLQVLLDEFVGASNSQVAAYAAAEQATQTKRTKKEALTGGMRADLNYAEYAVNGDDAKLNQIGWSGRMPPSPIAAPGQPLNFQVVRQSPGAVSLRWKRSAADGGPAAYFVIKRRGRGDDEEWTPVHTQTGVEAELTNQKRGKELEYCVTAVNRSGESLPSNSVMVVL
ncbi:MAG: fibronectin type III domain-containing protein [Candidatus Electronema sp. V4]|uniref:fibronectin type III domain-containing protein n=1 Tax=Candidatus Electronema sp. V4 TaxID=3454756 RepID=UPI004055554E